MTNRSLLQGKMREKDYTLDTLSKELDLSRTGLFNKIHNKAEFLISEVQGITRILNLTDEEVQLIFFTVDVELHSTKTINKKKITNSIEK